MHTMGEYFSVTICGMLFIVCEMLYLSIFCKFMFSFKGM